MDFPSLRAVARAQGLALDSKHTDWLDRFFSDLYRQNETTNLTRVRLEDADALHAADSLLVAEFVHHGAKVLDIGPGPGLPTVVLAVCRPDVHVVAVEATEKFAKFILAYQPANVEVVIGRAEDLTGRESVDVVTGRAVAPLGIQLEISAPWCRIGGLVVPFRTPTEAEDCLSLNAGQLGLELASLERRTVPGTDVVRLFPVYQKVRETPPEFPRPWARIKTRPLRPGSYSASRSASSPRPGSS